ncbi:hypothetical protein LUZ61_019629 [Rhynchospora tenuis]|uniref:Pentatricopeptide repeat-containing protein n=1 Tax=Rhynchospora tenuis TaxID=198213 RepID=A0AAD6EMZ9_9POAL|nr:hypothetical protein LUZ61_019629 [Rhynchospora tenuis]
MPEEVERVWKACGVRPDLNQSISVMLAWAKLGKIELAEQLFDKMSKQYKKLPQICYNSLLCIYVEKKMLDKAKDLVKHMSDDRFKIGVEALHMLVKFYVEEGDVAKADSMLQIWVRKNHKMQFMQIKPRYDTYIHLLEAYAKKGDYHNAEKMFYLTRQMGYSVRFKMYELLLRTYANARRRHMGLEID